MRDRFEKNLETMAQKTASFSIQSPSLPEMAVSYKILLFYNLVEGENKETNSVKIVTEKYNHYSSVWS